MTKLCRDLEGSSEFFDDAMKSEWIKTLSSYIGNDHKRLAYSHVSQWIFSIFQENQFSRNQKNDDIGRILTNLGGILNYLEKTEEIENAEELLGITRKLKDHINLANYQCSLFASSIEVFNSQMETRITEKEKKLRAEQKELIAAETKELTSQLVGLIAVFTALSFIVFGGITSLESLVQNLGAVEESVLPVVILAIAWAFCLMNLVFGFMYFVLHIIRRDVEHNKKQSMNFVQKYPVVVLVNYVLFVCLLIFGGIWYAERNGVGVDIYECLVVNNSTPTFLLGIVAIAAFSIGLAVYLRRLYKKPKTQVPPVSKEENAG